MKIIKAGDLSLCENPKTFECSRCRCEFIALSTEYQYAGIKRDEFYYKCECPTCGNMVYTNV